MQLISTNKITQTSHGNYNAVDIDNEPDPFYYAPEDGTITAYGDSGTCGIRLELVGATGRHVFCHNEYALVKVGDKVKRGQKLAKMGYTGLTDPDDVPAGTHCHWIVNRNGSWVYPPSLVNQSFIKLGEDMADKTILTKLWAGYNDQYPAPDSYLEYWDGKPVNEVLDYIEKLDIHTDLIQQARDYESVYKTAEDRLKDINTLATENADLKKALAAEGTQLKKGKYIV